MASIQVIATELGRASLLYRQAMGEEELKALAYSWAELFQEVNDADFVAAVKIHTRESKFFPTPADVLEAKDRVRPNRPPVLELEEMSVPDRVKRDAVYAAMLLASLRGNPSAKAFFETHDSQERDILVARVLGDTGSWEDGERRASGPRRFLQ